MVRALWNKQLGVVNFILRQGLQKTLEKSKREVVPKTTLEQKVRKNERNENDAPFLRLTKRQVEIHGCNEPARRRKAFRASSLQGVRGITNSRHSTPAH